MSRQRKELLYLFMSCCITLFSALFRFGSDFSIATQFGSRPSLLSLLPTLIISSLLHNNGIRQNRLPVPQDPLKTNSSSNQSSSKGTSSQCRAPRPLCCYVKLTSVRSPCTRTHTQDHERFRELTISFAQFLHRTEMTVRLSLRP